MKNILIAGGTDGLGLEIVRLLVNDPANNLTILGRNPEKIKDIIDRVNFIHIDISIESEIEKFEKSFEVQLDAVIISVGIFGHGPIESFTYSQMKESVGTNLLGHIFLTKALSKNMIEGSRIISINSMSGIITTKERSLLCAAKWGLRGFYGSLTEEWKSRKIMITQVFPGFFDSGYMDKVGIAKDKTNAIKKEVIANQVIDILNLPKDVYMPEIQVKNVSYT